MEFDLNFGTVGMPASATASRSDAPMYAAVDGRVASLSNSECIFQARDGGELHVMTHQVLQALDQCREFRSLDEHVARVAGVIPGLAGQSEAVRRVLGGMIERGVMRSDAQFLSGLSDPSTKAEAPLAALVIRACDRPAQLCRLLDSLQVHGRQHGRRDRLIVVDDSRQAGHLRDQQEMVAEYGKAMGVESRHIGPKQAASLIDRLARSQPPATRDALNTLLQTGAGQGFGGGRSYNIAVLLTAGRSLALIDDDYLLPFHRASSARGGFEPLGSTQFDTHFRASSAEALAAGQVFDGDGLAFQQALLGARLGQVVNADGGMAIDREQLRGVSLARLAHLRRDARILATFTGSRGASFTSDSAWMYQLAEDAREEFWRDREGYLHNIHAESIEFAPGRATARSFGLFTPFLLDNSQLLPCTAAEGRGEDGLFGAVGSYIHPDSLTLHLPITIGHHQEGRRPRHERAVQALTPGINRFMREWIRNQAVPARSADPAERLALLAAQLEDLAGASADERVGTLEEYLRYVRADLIDQLQQQLLAVPNAPVYWTADVRRIVEANGRALLNGAPPRLDEWPEHIDAAGCAERLRRACLELAAGFRLWPQLWRTARDQGERLLADS